MTKKSVFGLSQNIAAAIAYVGLCFTAVILLIFERENKFVRFHAMQSFIYFLTFGVLTFIIDKLPIVNWFLGTIEFAGLLIYLFLVFMAFTGKTFKIPVIGDIVWNQVNKD